MLPEKKRCILCYKPAQKLKKLSIPAPVCNINYVT